MKMTKEKNSKVVKKNGGNVISGKGLVTFLIANGGSANYHQIAVEFKLIDKEDMEIGSPLNSSIRNSIRKGWKEASGKLVTKGEYETFTLEGKKGSFYVEGNGSEKVGENKDMNSKVLTLSQK